LRGWNDLELLALSLDLPELIETTAWGNPCLKAHGKMWTWWSSSENAPVFKVSREERETLIEAEPHRFVVTPHDQAHALVLMWPEAFDPEWALANLNRTWRAQAPKRLLKPFDAERKRAT
jgi:hypothetical protein